MFRTSLRTARRVSLKPLKNVRMYHGEGVKPTSYNKPALLIAGLVTLGGVYIAYGAPTLVVKPEPVKKETEPVKEETEPEVNLPEPRVEDAVAEEQPVPVTEAELPAEAKDEPEVVDHERSPVEAEPIKSEEVELLQDKADADAVAEQSGDLASTSNSAAETVAGTLISSTKADEKKNADATADANNQQTAYNPETGEINWDCPCLGGMANGPCGEEFKEAFSCFVYSEADPKGIDCVGKFQNMQNCFREYPEYYAEQIKDEEEASAEAAKLEEKETTSATTATVTNEAHTETSVFEPVLEKYVEENPQLKDTPEAASVVSDNEPKQE